jgi:acyl carrier protein
MEPVIEDEDDLLPRALEIIESVCHKKVTAESRFIEDLNLDSIDFVGLISDLEEELDVVVDEEQMRKFLTVADAVDCFRALRNSGDEGP